MLTRRTLLHAIPTTLAAYAVGACRPGAPSDEDLPDPSTPDAADTDGGAPTPETDASCAPTLADIEGPFYRPDAPERADLTRVGDEGTPLLLAGRVLDADGCTPLAGAVVDLWQADPDGAYDNATGAMDYRAKVTCDAEGRWQIRTFEPGRYLNGAQYRPAHVHVKVWVDGEERLTTQLYFPGDPFNEVDPWYDPRLEVTRTRDGEAELDLIVEVAP
jgi:protocatechuate 3,4-dioxygenase beta subunit